MCKRILGYQSWHLNRKNVHDPVILQKLVDDVHSQKPDNIAVTGDLTNIALPREFIQAGNWLTDLGPPRQVAVIPGNHDAYVRVPWDQGLGHWEAYMTGEYALPDTNRENGFPYVRVRKNMALVALSSAVPSFWFVAGGRVGSAQLSALREVLPRLREQGFFRTVLVHHPPLPGQNKWRKALWNAAELKAIIAEHGAELVLHGHNHVHMHEELKTRHGTAHVFGVPSASAHQGKHKSASAWNLYEVQREDGAWHCNVQVRGWDEAGESFGKVRHFAIKFD